MQFSSFEEIDSGIEPLNVFEKLRSKNSVILHSGLKNSEIGKFSFIGIEPFAIFKSKGKKISFNGRKFSGNPFSELEKILKKFSSKKPNSHFPDFPLSSGGAIGFFSYDSVHFLEKIPRKAKDDLKIPQACFLFFDKITAFDHKRKKNFIFAIGKSKKDCENKILGLKNKIFAKTMDSAAKKHSFVGKLNSTFSKKEYISAINKVKDYIVAGDTFQVNLSQRFSAKTNIDPFDAFKLVCKINPSPFMAYFEDENFAIASNSPERLVCNDGKIAQTRPIAGTVPRGKNGKEDSLFEIELLSSEKEKAEHTMLVDLERNDLGKVCDYGSVRVSKEMFVEKYSHVMHIVSNVVGKLHKSKTNIELVKAMFPGGTITGCPKIRTMEIIDELEPVARGPYTGSLGYFDFSGKADFNILIRTFVFARKKVFINVGGGIVFDSIPEKEYLETIAKGKVLFGALRELK